MGQIVGQSTSANIVIGPLLNISPSVMIVFDIPNTAIVLIKENGVSAARGATTSALSVGPAMYRIVLNSADTNTLGTLTVHVSGSGAMLYAKDVEIWQQPTWALFYGSADAVAGSAAMSAMVSAVTSAVVSGVLNSYNVASAGEVASAGINSAGISTIVQAALVAYDVPTSARVSVFVLFCFQT